MPFISFGKGQVSMSLWGAAGWNGQMPVATGWAKAKSDSADLVGSPGFTLGGMTPKKKKKRQANKQNA